MTNRNKQGRREKGTTGEICPGPHSARGPILTNVTSITTDSYPCMLIFINKLYILTLPITGALHSLLASSVIHQPSLDHRLNDNNF